MRRIYFVSGDVSDQSIPELTLSLELWENSYKLVMSMPVGKVLHNLWRHHFGAEAEMRLSGSGLRRLETGVKKLLATHPQSAELNDFLRDLTKASASARSKHYDMIVIAE